MDKDFEDRLNNVELNQSDNSERFLMNMGALLYKTLIAASRVDEMNLLIGFVREYAQMTSQYGEKTDRIPESIAVDLNEATIMKLELLTKRTKNKEWSVFAKQFADNLLDTSALLGIKIII